MNVLVTYSEGHELITVRGTPTGADRTHLTIKTGSGGFLKISRGLIVAIHEAD